MINSYSWSQLRDWCVLKFPILNIVDLFDKDVYGTNYTGNPVEIPAEVKQVLYEVMNELYPSFNTCNFKQLSIDQIKSSINGEVTTEIIDARIRLALSDRIEVRDEEIPEDDIK